MSLIEVECPRWDGRVELEVEAGRAACPEMHVMDPALTDEPSHPFTTAERWQLEEQAEELDREGARDAALERWYGRG